jgi:hypothetical protein
MSSYTILLHPPNTTTKDFLVVRQEVHRQTQKARPDPATGRAGLSS